MLLLGLFCRVRKLITWITWSIGVVFIEHPLLQIPLTPAAKPAFYSCIECRQRLQCCLVDARPKNWKRLAEQSSLGREGLASLGNGAVMPSLTWQERARRTILTSHAGDQELIALRAWQGYIIVMAPRSFWTPHTVLVEQQAHIMRQKGLFLYVFNCPHGPLTPKGADLFAHTLRW